MVTSIVIAATLTVRPLLDPRPVASVKSGYFGQNIGMAISRSRPASPTLARRINRSRLEWRPSRVPILFSEPAGRPCQRFPAHRAK